MKSPHYPGWLLALPYYGNCQRPEARSDTVVIFICLGVNVKMSKKDVRTMLVMPQNDEVLIVQLTRSQTTLIDSIDADLGNVNWMAQYSLIIDGYYAVRFSAGGITSRIRIQMHRVILERILGIQLTRQDYVDHKNHNTLDNRRENLRLASPTQNAQNKKISARNTSGYKGVSWYKNIKKWKATIRANNHLINLGYYDTKIEAAIAYNNAATEHFGEFCVLNIIGDGDLKK